MSDRAILETKLPALAALLRENGIIGNGALRIERQFTAGQSNPTYLLGCGDRQFVLRKQPYGRLLPKAHDVVREHDIMNAVGASGFPVPPTVMASRDAGVIGTAFFLMDYVPGQVHSSAQLPHNTQSERLAIYTSMAGTLAALHAIDPSVLEQAGIRPRGGFIERQVNAWRGAYLASLTEEQPLVDTVARWLIDNRPTRENVAIAHGDYRLENLIFDNADVAAVLDWELCTVGEPLSDVAYTCLWYHFPTDILDGLSGFDLRSGGIPDEGEFLELYSRDSGIDAHATRDYFLAFAFFRLAAILQGVYKRALDGNAASPEAMTRGATARFCLDRAVHFSGL